MIPPFNTPGNASYLDCGIHSETTSSPFGKLRMRKPSALAGPQPKHELLGAYFSWSDLFSILAARYQRQNYIKAGGHTPPLQFQIHAPFFDPPPYGRGAGPVYSDSGRIKRLLSCCSTTCAHQPATREAAKIGVFSAGSNSSIVNTGAA